MSKIWKHRKIADEYGCMECTYFKNQDKYPIVDVQGTKMLVHRVVYADKVGRWPDAKQKVRHLDGTSGPCQGPPCINSDHLIIGDDVLNARDRVEANKPRKTPVRMTSALLEEAARLRRYEGLVQKEIAERINVSWRNFQQRYWGQVLAIAEELPDEP